jgi:anti-sigma regulatory factor (Ser/Thr protein kinase)
MTRIENRLDYRLAATPAAVSAGRAAVTRVLDADVPGLAGETREAIRLAVTELCANVVRHAYAPGRPGELWLTIALADGALVVGVRDFGRGMDGTSARKGVGLGMRIARESADDFEVREPGDGGAEVRMRFRVPRDGQSTGCSFSTIR